MCATYHDSVLHFFEDIGMAWQAEATFINWLFRKIDRKGAQLPYNLTKRVIFSLPAAETLLETSNTFRMIIFFTFAFEEFVTFILPQTKTMIKIQLLFVGRNFKKLSIPLRNHSRRLIKTIWQLLLALFKRSQIHYSWRIFVRNIRKQLLVSIVERGSSSLRLGGCQILKIVWLRSLKEGLKIGL